MRRLLDRLAVAVAARLQVDDHRRRVRVLTVSAVLFTVIFGARFADVGPTSPIILFIVVPMALLSVEFGAVGGTLAGALSMLLLAWWLRAKGLPHQWTDDAIRCFAFGVAGFLMGLICDAARVLHDNSYIDPLTGLLNRARFNEVVERHQAEVCRYGPHGAILLLDLDHFKDVNDTYGHHVGDHLLRQVADRLRSRVRETDVLCRLGGDEFAILLKRSDAEQACVAAASIVSALSENAYRIVDGLTGTDHLDLSISASVGVAPFLKDETSAQAVIRADVGMYSAKRAGGRGHSLQATKPVGSFPLNGA